MIKITKASDLNNTTHPLTDYIKDLLLQLTTDSCTDSIEEFGVIYVIEDSSDLNAYQTMGFYKPIAEYLPEYINRIHIKDSSQTYIESCYVFSDNFGVVVFAQEKIFQGSYSFHNTLNMEIYKEIFHEIFV